MIAFYLTLSIHRVRGYCLNLKTPLYLSIRRPMKKLLMLTLLFICSQLSAQVSSYEVAQSVKELSDFKELINSSFGGGHYIPVKKSDYHIVDLMQTSGIYSTEYFIYKKVENKMQLVAYLPYKGFYFRRAEYLNNKLQVFGRKNHDTEWELELELIE